MSWMDEYNKAKKKLKKEEESIDKSASTGSTTGNSWVDKYKSELSKLRSEEEYVLYSHDFSEKEEEEKERTWFDTSVLDKDEDGLLGKVALGTAVDTGENLVGGLLNIGESFLDALAWLAPAYNVSQQAQSGLPYTFDINEYRKEQQNMSEFIQKDLYDGTALAKTATQILTAPIVEGGFDMDKGYKSDEYSILGEKTEGVLQSGGQLAGTIALQGMGVPWFITSGATSFGSEAESALKQGATYEEAGVSGAVSAGAEIISESLGGFFGKTELDDLLVKEFSKKFSNKLVRAAGTIGIKGGTEALEELFSWAGSKLGQKLTYEGEKTWAELYTSEEAVDELIESMIGGFALGGFGTSVDAVKSGIDYKKNPNTARDIASGMTMNEESVVKKVYEAELAKKKGTVSAKEKRSLYDTIQSKMERGYISAEQIEEVLGGDEYTTYKAEEKKVLDSDDYKAYRKAVEDSKVEISRLETQLKEIGDKQSTVANTKQYEAIEQRLNELKKNPVSEEIKAKIAPEVSRVIGMRDKMRSNVMRTVDGTRLMESYREMERKKQKFQADVNQYTNENAKKTVQSILDSGLGDNSNQFHDTVEFLAKLSADKGVTFNLTKTDLLKGTEHYKEGYITNGFVNDNGDITLNVDSKILRSTVGHEVTHVLEKAGVYKELQSAVRDFAIAKEGLEAYNARLKAAEDAYRGKKNTTPEGEITADLIGEYLFTDSDFVNALSTENRNVFQRIYDEIKYMVKVAVAGSDEARELEKVKKLFDKAYRENVRGKPKTELETEANEAMDAEVDDVQYSVSVEDKETLDFLNEQVSRGEYDAETNPDGGYYVTYKSMSFWGYDEDGNAILRSPMAEYVDGKLSGAYLMPKDKSKLNWYKATETIDEKTGLPSGLLVGVKEEGKKSKKYVPASENQDLIAEDWSNLYFMLNKKVFNKKTGKWKNSPVPARYNPYEHSSNSMLNDQFKAAWQRDNLVTVKMYVPVSEDNGAYRAQWSKDPTGWSDWKSGDVATKINKQKDLQRRVYLSRYAAPVEIVPDSEVAQAYKGYLEGTDVAIPDNVVSPSLLKELKNAGVPIVESGNVQYSMTKDTDYMDAVNRNDTETMQKMVDEAAKESGYTYFGYRSDYVKWNAFDMSKAGTGYGSKYGKGIYLALDESIAEEYGEYYEEDPRAFYAKITNPYIMDITGQDELEEIAERWFEVLDRAGFEYDQSVKSKYLHDSPHYWDNDVVSLIYDTTGEDDNITAEILTSLGYDGLVDYGGMELVVFAPEQVKSADPVTYDNNGNIIPLSERFKSDNDDIRYSLTKDTNGNDLTDFQKEFFKDSKVVDDNGNLKVLYHGTASGEFTIFDKAKGSVEGDFGSGFYFTDNGRDVAKNYEGGGPDFENKVARLAERIEAEEEIDYDEAEKRARAELYKGSHKFEVYLNIKNPAIVGKTILFDPDSYFGEYDQDDYDSEEDYESDVEQLISDKISDIIWDVERNVDVYGTLDELANVMWEAVNEGGIGIEELKRKINDLYLEDSEGNFVGNEVARQVIEGLGYDGIIDNTVSTKWNMDMDSGTTHYIAFKPHQIKNVTNQEPTPNLDIRYSLTKDSDGNQLTLEQEEFFKDSKIRDENGNLMPMYHGTKKGGFTVFDGGKDYWYFTKDKEYTYAFEGRRDNGELYPFVQEGVEKGYYHPQRYSVYLNVKNPFVTDDIDIIEDALYWDKTLPEQLRKQGYDALMLEDMSQVIVLNQNQIKNMDNTNPTTDPDIRYSLTKDTTKQQAYHDYLEAVNSGDTDTAQKLLDGFAKDAGYNYRGVHRSFANFTVFDREKIGSNAGTRLGDGFYVTLEFKDEATARYADESYGKNRMDLYVKMESPLVLGTPMDESIINKMEEDFSEFGWFGEDSTAYYAVTPEKIKKIFLSNDGYEQMETIRLIANRNSMEISELLKQYGFDSVIDENDYVKQAVVFDEAQLKSAEPVTYDEYGDVIMPYERFDADNMDIRYSMTPDGTKKPDDINDVMWSPRNDPMDDFAPIAENATTETETSTGPIVGNATPPKEEDKVKTKIQQKIENTQAELDKNRQLMADNLAYYDEEIAKKQAEYDSKQNKNSQTAQGILRSIERLKRLRANSEADYSKRIGDLEQRVEKLHSKDYNRAEVRRTKQAERMEFWSNLIGDTSSWKDFALGVTYKTKTLRRILRKVVRDGRGNPDINLADNIYDELETKYDHNEAQLKMESQKLKEVFFNLKMNHHEDTYAHMVGELRHNPETTLTQDVVDEYYQKHKNKIDTEKVETAIKEARKTFDDLIVRVNEVLKANGIKEVPYRKGYFPHFTNPKQNWLQKLLNWKPIDTEIPTSIAGLTQDFKPVKSWQSFAQRRKGDTTDYSLYQGLDTYIHGALDWIYHIDDIQSRRALENYIREIHSDEGVQKRIQEIRADDSLDALEVQDAIDAVLNEANNPLSGFVRELMNRTNTLANKKSSMDREMEDMFNRKVYSTMTNLNNRVNANMVVGSFSSALTNFIPMVQSWHQVSPVYTVRGLKDMIRSTIKDDGTIAKSDFLTNRLIDEEKLYKTGWDKASDKAAFMMNAIDNITSQTVWRSKYLQNLHDGMSESAAIKDADQFAKNLIAGRSRGNMPSIFDAKNPLTKLFTAFQLEVANQYGYMFEDAPQDSPTKARLVKGYATAFLGAYVYNALYSSMVGRDAALDPIAIIQELIGDLLDDDEEPEEDLKNFGANILEEVPFVGSLMGGGRIPLSSAFPYANDSTPFQSMMSDLEKYKEGDKKPLVKEMLKPLYYLVLPFGGGQIKKTNEGLGMFSDDHPIAGSYTDSGRLRFPVDDTIGSRVQAAMFGQYASQNARDYFDEGRSALTEKQTQEFIDSELPIRDYWEYRDGLKGLTKIGEKFDYIDSLDLPISTKNLFINNISDRKEPIDMAEYSQYDSYEEFDFAQSNPKKYDFLEGIGVSYKQYKYADEDTKDAYDWAYEYPESYTLSKAVTDDVVQYKEYSKALDAIRSKDENGFKISTSVKERKTEYINSLNIEYGAKLILFKNEYNADDTYNNEIIEYLNNKNDLTFDEKLTILRKLGFAVTPDGHITWD